jgi:hypothetical protein
LKLAEPSDETDDADPFSRLLCLTKASEACGGHALSFIDYFGHRPTFSTDHIAAASQASQRRRSAERRAEELLETIAEWDKWRDALDYIGQAVGINLPPITVDGSSYQTAHEALRFLAKAVYRRFSHAQGETDADWCCALADQLDGFENLPDLSARLEGESYAAGNLTPALRDDNYHVAKQPPINSGRGTSLDTDALAVYLDHPDWTKKRIAEYLRSHGRPKCNEKSLSPKRCKKLAAAIAAHRVPDLPRGSKDSDGNIDAWE